MRRFCSILLLLLLPALGYAQAAGVKRVPENMLDIAGLKGVSGAQGIMVSNNDLRNLKDAVTPSGPSSPCVPGDDRCQSSLQSFQSFELHLPLNATPCELFIENLPADVRLGLSLGSLYQTPGALTHAQAAAFIHENTEKCLSSNVPKSAESLIGIFINDAGDLLGMGTLEDATHVLTAKHVLYPPYTGQPVPLRSPDSIYFVPASQPSSPIALDPQSFSNLPPFIDFGKESQTNDHIVVHLLAAAKFNASNPPKIQAPPLSPTQITVVGLNEQEMEVDNVDLVNDRNVNPKWASYLAIDTRPICKTLVVSQNTCVIHGCSTFAGMSGTAVFDSASLSSPQAEIYAVHVGTPQMPCSIQIPGGVQINVAVTP
ncbi:hypothetical protein AAHK20_15075 [Trinickia sp. YCB016]